MSCHWATDLPTHKDIVIPDPVDIKEEVEAQTEVEEVENEVEEEASNYGFEDGSQFFNDSEVFPQFIKNTVVEFSNPSGEDGKKSNLKWNSS